jgi:hypothetical protein
MSPEDVVKLQVRLNSQNPQDNCITTYLVKAKAEAESKGLRFNESQTVRDLLTAGIKALSGAAVAAPDSQPSDSIANNDDLVRLIRQTISESGGEPVNSQQVKEIVIKSMQEMIPEIQKAIVSQMFSGLQPAAATAGAAAAEKEISDVTQQLTDELAADLMNSQF